MNKEFVTHMLNEAGETKAKRIAQLFDDITDALTTAGDPANPSTLCPPSRETSIMRTKLEEACFFAKKAMASTPGNTGGDDSTGTLESMRTLLEVVRDHGVTDSLRAEIDALCPRAPLLPSTDGDEGLNG